MIRPTIFFEFDGIVADTTRARIAAVARAVREWCEVDGDEVAVSMAGLTAGQAAREVAQRVAPELDDTDLDLLALSADREYSAQVAKGVLLVDGAKQTLERLASEARLVIVSALRRNDVGALVNLAQLDDYITTIIGAEDARPGKPNPAPYRAALERIRPRDAIARPNRHFACESTGVGIASARHAGLPVIAVGQVPPHIALDANGYIATIAGESLSSLQRVLGIAAR